MSNTNGNNLYYIKSEPEMRMTQNYNNTVKQMVAPVNEINNDKKTFEDALKEDIKNSKDRKEKRKDKLKEEMKENKLENKLENNVDKEDINNKLLKAVETLNNKMNLNSKNIEISKKKEKENKIKSTDDIFWYDNISILFKFDNLLLFFPVGDMTLNQRLNALTRLCIYIGVILYLFTEKTYYIILILISLVVIYVVHNNMNKNENFEVDNIDKVKPTANNPFMNFNIITDNPNRPGASDISKEEVKKDANNKFKMSSNMSSNENQRLFRSTFDLYDRNNSQRQFYTMPSTTLPNDQTAFAKWCYSTGPTCKERTLYCAPNYISNNNKR